MSGLSPERRDELEGIAFDVLDGRLDAPIGGAAYHVAEAIADVVRPWLAAEREAGAAEVRARVEAVERAIANAAAQPTNDYSAAAWRQVLHVAGHDLRVALNGGE